MKAFRIVVERHSDGYIAYPVGITGAVIGEGNTRQEALEDVRSAIRFHLETFGPDAPGADEKRAGSQAREHKEPLCQKP